MKYHYYIGLQLPPQLRKQVTELQTKLFEPIDSTEPLEPHITLLPPPAVGEIEPTNLAMHVKAAAQWVLPLEIRLTGTINFGDRAVAIRAESKALHTLQKQLVEVLPFETDVTYFPDPRFTPHITLVQAIRGKTLPAKLIATYEQAAQELLPTSFKATHLTLFEWTKPRQYKAKRI